MSQLFTCFFDLHIKGIEVVIEFDVAVEFFISSLSVRAKKDYLCAPKN